MSPRLENIQILLKVYFICIFIVPTAVQSRRVTLERQYQLDDEINEEILRAVELLLAERRTLDADSLAKARILFNAYSKKLLRQNDDKAAVIDAGVGPDMEGVVEHELQDSLAKKSSAILERPFVQHKGVNDFLVLKPGANDPFVTVVPNDIYYNVEKKCVNWLDDCNLRGLRERLLQRVESPYK